MKKMGYEINARLANTCDILQVIDLRMEYLKSSYYTLGEAEPIIKDNNSKYLHKNINKTCYVAIGFLGEELCSCAYMNIMEKAANLRFPEGIYGEIYGVYTNPEYRHMGIATETLKVLVTKGKELKLPYIQLGASKSGCLLYQKLGFEETGSGYKEMGLFLNNSKCCFN